MPDPLVLVGKAITLTFGADVFTEQTTSAMVVAEPQTDTITNTVGQTIDIDKGTKFTLKLSAMQDWTNGAAGLFGLLAAAYDADAVVDFEMELAKGTATATVTGQCKGRRGDFGGDSAALLSDLELPIVDISGPVYVAGVVVALDLAALEDAGLTGSLESELAGLGAEARASAPSPSPAGSATTQRVTVTLEDGTAYDVTLDARDRRAYALFADRYALPAFTLDADSGVDVLRLELLTVFSAWHATRYRLNLHRLDWPAWNGAVIDVALQADAPEVAPYPPGRGAA